MEQQLNASPAPMEFSPSSLFTRAWQTLTSYPLVFLGITLAPTLIVTIVGILLALISPLLATIIIVLGGIVLNLVAQGAIAYGTFESMTGNEPTIRNAFSKVMPRIIPLVCLAAIVGLCVFLGFIILIIPGIIVMCMFAVSMQACVVEQKGALDSISRSLDLTKGYRVQIFLIFLALGLAVFILFAIIAVVVGLIFNETITQLVINLIGIVPSAFGSILAAILYYDLRNIKEGISLDSLTKVFD